MKQNDGAVGYDQQFSAILSSDQKCSAMLNNTQQWSELLSKLSSSQYYLEIDF